VPDRTGLRELKRLGFSDGCYVSEAVRRNGAMHARCRVRFLLLSVRPSSTVINAVTSLDDTSKQRHKNVCDRPFCEATSRLTAATLLAGEEGSDDSDLRIIGLRHMQPLSHAAVAHGMLQWSTTTNLIRSITQ